MTQTALDRLEAVVDDGPLTRAQQLDLVADLLARRAIEPYHCAACITDHKEPFCPSCGLHLDRASRPQDERADKHEEA